MPMCSTSIRVSFHFVFPLLVLAAGTGGRCATIEGNCVDPGGRGLFESRLWASRVDGEGSGFAYVGSIPGEGPGAYRISSLPGGVYCLAMTRPRLLRGFVEQGIVLPEGGTLNHNILVPQNYAVHDVSEWESGQTFWQTFKASGDSVNIISIYVAGTPGGDGAFSPSVLVSVNEAVNGAQIGPSRRVAAHTATGTYARSQVEWQAGEIPTTPGHVYAVRIEGQVHPTSGSPNWVGASWSPYTVSNEYPDGMMYTDGTPRPDRDMNLTIGSDDDGIITNVYRPSIYDTIMYPGPNPEAFGQTFIARGYAVAAAEFVPTVGFGKWIDAQIRFYTYSGNPQSPRGAPLGPAKHVAENSDTSHAVAFAQGEVPLVPGNIYYMEGTAYGGGFINAYYAPNYYPGGDLFVNQTRIAGADLDVVILEYKDYMDTPTPTISPTPTATFTPPRGPNLVRNGDMEQGVTGTSGEIPDEWTRWDKGASPYYWYMPDYGRNGSRGARVIGGAINGSIFDGGMVQAVGGLSRLGRYDLSGWARANLPDSVLSSGYLGYDLTGQTTNGAAPTLVWLPACAIGGSWEHIFVRDLVPVSTTISLWTRGRNAQADQYTYFVDFDDVSLVRSDSDAASLQVY